MNWIIDNAEWLFSGVAVAVLTAVIGLFFRKKRSVEQSASSGKGSVTIQVVGNYSVTDTVENDSAKK